MKGIYDDCASFEFYEPLHIAHIQAKSNRMLNHYIYWKCLSNERRMI